MATTARSLTTPAARQRVGTSLEFYSWIFMRVSGILLLFLVLGHLTIMHIVDGGVARVNFAFVAGRWSNPFWQTYDWAMLMLATVHGTNGLRIIVEDYIRNDAKRMYTKFVLYTVAFFMLVLGTFVIVAFDPCAGDAPLAVCR